MNSLDVPTNSVSQVAAAIEEKRKQSRAERPPNLVRGTATTERGSPRRLRTRTVQGQAFAAPRSNAMDRQRELQEDLRSIQDIIDESPRARPDNVASATSNRRRGRVLNEGDANDLRNAVLRGSVGI